MEPPQAEIAAVPATAPAPEAAPAVTAPASNPTPQPFFDAAAADAELFGDSTPAPAVEKSAATTQPAEPAPSATPAVAAPSEPQPAGTTPPAATEAAPAVEPTPEPTEKILPSRISTKQFPPVVQKTMAVFHDLKDVFTDEAARWDAAEKIVAEENKQAEKAAASEAERIAANPDPVDVLESEVAKIEAEIRQAGADGMVIESPELAELQISLAQKMGAMALAKFQREQSQREAERSQESAVDAVYAESRSEMLSKYPSAAREGSILYDAIQKEATELQKPGHPDRHRIDGQSDAPKFLTQRGIARVASDLGISFEQADAMLSGGKVPVATPAPAPKVPVATPAPGPQPAAAMNLNPAAGNSQTAQPAKPPSESETLARSLRPGFNFDDDLNLTGNGLYLS